MYKNQTKQRKQTHIHHIWFGPLFQQKKEMNSLGAVEPQISLGAVDPTEGNDEADSARITTSQNARPTTLGYPEYRFPSYIRRSTYSPWDLAVPLNLSIGEHVFNNLFGVMNDLDFKIAVPSPKRIDMCGLEDRVKSFTEKGWPRQLAQSPLEMAQAGFFYTGYGDRAQTFCCGNVVVDWHHMDKPWEEHKRHFPKCKFPTLRKNM